MIYFTSRCMVRNYRRCRLTILILVVIVLFIIAMRPADEPVWVIWNTYWC